MGVCVRKNTAFSAKGEKRRKQAGKELSWGRHDQKRLPLREAFHENLSLIQTSLSRTVRSHS